MARAKAAPAAALTPTTAAYEEDTVSSVLCFLCLVSFVRKKTPKTNVKTCENQRQSQETAECTLGKGETILKRKAQRLKFLDILSNQSRSGLKKGKKHERHANCRTFAIVSLVVMAWNLDGLKTGSLLLSDKSCDWSVPKYWFKICEHAITLNQSH